MASSLDEFLAIEPEEEKIETHSVLMKNVSFKKYNDNINDIYKVNIINKMIINKEFDSEYAPYDCTLYMDKNCKEVMDELNIKHVYLTSDVNKLKQSTNVESLLNYIDKLEKDKSYIIIRREENNKIYYASLIEKRDKNE